MLPPSFHRCGSIRFFRASFRSAATYLQPKGELVFHSLHYVPPIPLHSIKLHYIHSFRQALLRPRKRNCTPRKKLRQHSWAVIALISLTLHSVLSACRPRSTRNGFALHFGGRESTPLSLRRFPTASLLKAAFPALFSAVTAPTQSSAYKKWRLISFSSIFFVIF